MNWEKGAINIIQSLLAGILGGIIVLILEDSLPTILLLMYAIVIIIIIIIAFIFQARIEKKKI